VQSLIRDASITAAIIGAIVSGSLIILWELLKLLADKSNRRKSIKARLVDSVGHDLAWLERRLDDNFTLREIELGLGSPKGRFDDRVWQQCSAELFALDRQTAGLAAQYYHDLSDFRRVTGDYMDEGEKRLARAALESGRKVFRALGGNRIPRIEKP